MPIPLRGTGIPSGQRETVAWLRRQAGAEPIETHISLVFVGVDTVWKLKKAVLLPFLDFTGIEDRRRFLERELALNGPAAPGLYRDVVAVVRHADGGLGFADAGAAAPLDWVLRMARVPGGDFLDAMADAGQLDPPLLDALADAVAAYHARCPAAPPQSGLPLREITRGNARSARAAGLPEAEIADWEQAELAALGPLDDWQQQREDAGYVRRAHGDLHLGNLCLWQGRPVPFDALEFDERMATIDLGYDLAFLLMDLDRRVGRAAANRVMNRYAARTGDTEFTRALPVWLSQRAMVLAHVRASRGDARTARCYLEAAHAYLRPAPAIVVAVGGLQASGKSTLARVLAPELGNAPGALVLRSDEIRKRLHGAAPEQKLPAAAYSEAVSTAVFATIAEAVRDVAGGGHAVIADATFIDPKHRRLVAAAARAARVAFVGFWLDAPLPVLETRLTGRHGDASDATITVLHAAARARTIPPRDWHILDATDPAVAARATPLLRAALSLPPQPC